MESEQSKNKAKPDLVFSLGLPTLLGVFSGFAVHFVTYSYSQYQYLEFPDDLSNTPIPGLIFGLSTVYFIYRNVIEREGGERGNATAKCIGWVILAGASYWAAFFAGLLGTTVFGGFTGALILWVGYRLMVMKIPDGVFVVGILCGAIVPFLVMPVMPINAMPNDTQLLHLHLLWQTSQMFLLGLASWYAKRDLQKQHPPANVIHTVVD